MLPDTLEGSIHDLTQNILADYTAGRPIDRIEPFNQPDRDVIIALIGKLRRIVFPGYFRDPAYHVYSAAHSLSALIEDTAYLLQKQIAIALRCGSSVTQEAAADIDRGRFAARVFVVVGTVWISCAFWLIATNSVFDADVGMSHISTVSQTRATSRYCYMDVVWDGRTLDFPVSKEDFSAISAGDEVLVTAYDGFWGAPYYTWEIPQSP